MFYCDDCANEYGYPETLMKSEGNCEVCGKHRVCNEMRSSLLPSPKVSETETQGLSPENQDKVFWIDAKNMSIKPEELLMVKGKGVMVKGTSRLLESIEKQMEEMKNSLRVNFPVIEVPSTGKPDWSDGARTMAFVYSKFKGNFILRGFHGEVERFLKKNFSHYFVYISMWHKGESRGYWEFWKNGVTILEPNRSLRRNKRYRYEIYSNITGGRFRSLKELGEARKKTDTNRISLKRLPKHWIPEFDRF